MGKRRKDWLSSQVGRRKTVLQLNDHRHVEESPPLSPKRLPSGYPAWSPPRHNRPDPPSKKSGLPGERSMDAEVAEFLKEISALSTSEEAEGAAADADSENVEGKESKIDGNTKVEKDNHDSSVETNNHIAGSDTSSWQECFDERTQFHYYWNVGTNEVSWHPPPGFPAHPDLVATNDSGSQKMDTDDDELEEKVELITFYGPPSPEEPSLKKRKNPKVIGPQLPSHVVKEQSSLDPHNCEVEEPIIYGPHLPAKKPEKIVSVDSPKYGPPLPPDMKLPKPDILNDEISKRRKRDTIEKDILEEADLLLAQKKLLKQLKSEEKIIASRKSKKSSARSIIEEEKFQSRNSPLSEGQCSKSSDDEQPVIHRSFTGVETPPVFSSPSVHKPNVNDFIVETPQIKKKRKDDKEKRYRRHKEHKTKKHSRDDSDKKHHHKEKHRKHLESSISSASSASSTEEVQRLRRHKENLKKAIKQDLVEMNKKLEHSKNPPPAHLLSGTHYYEDEDSAAEKIKKGMGNKLDQENLLRKSIKQSRSSFSKKQTVSLDKNEKAEALLVKIKQEKIENDTTATVAKDNIPDEPIDYEEIDRQLELALEKKLKGIDDKVDKKNKSKHNIAKPTIKEEKDEKTRSRHRVSEKIKSKEHSSIPKSSPAVIKKEKEEKSSKPPKIDNNSNSSSPKDAISVETIEEMARTICEKLEFLDVSRKTISKLHILILELETRVMDYHAGALEKHYFISKLKEAANQLHHFENSAVPTGWSCHWDRDFKRYFYSNGITGQTQWDYPEEKAVPENVKPPKADEHPQTETKKILKEKKNVKVEPHRTRPISSSIPTHPIVESSEPPPPGVDDIPPPLSSGLTPIHPQTVDLEEGEIEDVEMEIEESSTQPDSSYPSNSDLGLVIAKPPQPAASNYYLYGETNCIAAPGVFPAHPPVPVGGFSSQTIAYSNYSAALQPSIAIYSPHPGAIPNPPKPVAPPVEITPPTQPDVQTNGTKVEEVKSTKKEKKFKKKKISLSLKKKNLSSLVEKWQQIKEEVARISESESEEEKPTTFEEWKRQQIESGEALDNANFEEIGDWRARLLKSKSKKP